MIYTIAFGSLAVGTLCGIALIRKNRFREFIAIVGCLALFVGLVVMAPASVLPADRFAIQIAAFAVSPPMIGGMIGGALFGFLIRRHFGAA